jgi:hypothetical protein
MFLELPNKNGTFFSLNQGCNLKNSIFFVFLLENPPATACDYCTNNIRNKERNNLGFVKIKINEPNACIYAR